MRIALKISASVIAFAVIMLGSALAFELYFGQPRAGFVPIATIVLMAPALYLIWRKRQ